MLPPGQRASSSVITSFPNGAAPHPIRVTVLKSYFPLLTAGCLARATTIGGTSIRKSTLNLWISSSIWRKSNLADIYLDCESGQQVIQISETGFTYTGIP